MQTIFKTKTMNIFSELYLEQCEKSKIFVGVIGQLQYLTELAIEHIETQRFSDEKILELLKTNLQRLKNETKETINNKITG